MREEIFFIIQAEVKLGNCLSRLPTAGPYRLSLPWIKTVDTVKEHGKISFLDDNRFFLMKAYQKLHTILNIVKSVSITHASGFKS